MNADKESLRYRQRQGWPSIRAETTGNSEVSGGPTPLEDGGGALPYRVPWPVEVLMRARHQNPAAEAADACWGHCRLDVGRT